MQDPIEKSRDLVGGVVVMALGAGFLLSARALPFGSSGKMGPGYFPIILSVILIALGGALAIAALRRSSSEGSFGHIAWRGVLLVVGAVIFFGLAMEGLGLAPALFAVVLAAAAASRYARVRTGLPLAIGLAAFCSLLFIKALGMPMPLVGPWLSTEFWWPAASSSLQ
ncbi:tripartite tricarboxylate transporter TctB family protein [Paracoccus aerius]|uniref:Tripartite tricarboxylate transporter TctB family protein n=1 Tax=Paracoccus aerius TaxID=1915382 RepID=A0ABS1S9Y6_9RHOB|nr:tripartite tricarboxylate transporter TctB family protein [Paracoccus aerius]MBL3675545.1 tripartite tricarboxylate transporter TctB family protein [Paracoccus aerius]GHG35497.1 membrane protein [Paracoccus aerius]